MRGRVGSDISLPPKPNNHGKPNHLVQSSFSPYEAPSTQSLSDSSSDESSSSTPPPLPPKDESRFQQSAPTVTVNDNHVKSK